ncbi:MAG: aminotransferase class I/II-fold pyridoxal phosphate-dependent enzyme [Pseudomonadota bacterium]|nr:aminotransferase class I/II-fold pyridoxal phosphate-dependent enzyme [Pseudomonadota bacterium]
MSLLDKFAVQRGLAASLAENSRLAPIATPMDDVHSATSATIDGRRVILAGTNNYLGLTYDAECRAAAIAAIESLGTGTTGSRMASGNYAGHRALEQALATAFGWPAAIIFSTGYQANLGALSALASEGDFLLVDADSHASIHDGCRLSHATTIRFRHNDPENLDRRLERLGDAARRTLVVVESLYSTLGDRAPLREIVEITRRHGAWLLVDEAHSFGVFGPCGLGLCEELGLLDDVDFIVGTFSKSLGGIGGFCLGRHAELELMRMVSRPYIFTASPAPSAIAATHQALRSVLRGHDLRARLWRNAERLYAEVARLGYRLGTTAPGPVAALVFEAREPALALWQSLIDAGIYTNLMIPPATPAGLSLVRISLSAAQSVDDITQIIAALDAHARQSRPPLAA